MRANKRGFTITELVIVIVVIAILAAVLIPTFASLIKKANISADTQLAKNLNTALVMDEAVNGKPDEFGEALDAMREAGYLLANMNPTADGCYLAWEKETNQVLLVELADNSYKVLYSAKEGYGDPDDSWYFAVKDQAAADAIKAVLANVKTEMTIMDTTVLNEELASVSGEKTIYIDASLAVDEAGPIVLDNANAKITMDLGNSKISGHNNKTLSIENVPFQLSSGELTLKGGIIEATGDMLDSDGEVMNNVIHASAGVLNVEGSEINAPDSTIAIALTGGVEATFKDTKIVANDNVVQPTGSKVLLDNCDIECGWLAIFSSSSGGTAAEVTIKGGTYHATISNLLGVHGGVITVEDGTFNCDTASKTLKFYNITGGKIVLKGGTFNGVAFANLDEAAIRAMCNLSDCSKGITVEQVNGAWEITVK